MSLYERLADPKQTVIVGEGYLFELERRGFIQPGPFVPEVVLDNPRVVQSLYEEFVQAGSDVVVALTYFGNRGALRSIGRESELEKLNRQALKLATSVAKTYKGVLVAGNLCNTNLYHNEVTAQELEEIQMMFQEQIIWAVEEKADFLIGETFSHLGEAQCALEMMKKHGQNLATVITLAPGLYHTTEDGYPISEACRILESMGATVTGLNCSRGPATMKPIMEEVRAACKGPIACLPVMFRTSIENPVMQCLPDRNGGLAFPLDLDCHHCSRSDVAKFAEWSQQLGIKYLGTCCGGAAHYIRTLRSALGQQNKHSYAFNHKLTFGHNYKSQREAEEIQKIVTQLPKALPRHTGAI